LHQTRPEHATHRFSADTSDCTAGGRAGGSASADGSSNGVSTRGVQGGAGAGEDWTWEGLQAFEETIRAQQRKVRRSTHVWLSATAAALVCGR
jgi:hypothetical protein